LSRVHDALRSAGIGLAGDAAPAVRVECARLARRMREQMVNTIGLVPAGDDVAVPAVAVELGRALADKSEAPVAVIDGHRSWACAAALVDGSPADGTFVATSWVTDRLAVLTPRTFDAATTLGKLYSAIADRGTLFGNVVVDLTGFDHLGEQLAAIELLDGTVIVARSARTTTRQIQRWLQDIPEWSSLGVLLTGL